MSLWTTFVFLAAIVYGCAAVAILFGYKPDRVSMFCAFFIATISIVTMALEGLAE